jgi:hypothetical protein
MLPDIGNALIDVALLWMLTTPHEFAHAWTAEKLGDDTPRLDGRVTLHPLAHVDWLGTVILPAVTSLLGGGFLGWGKPVRTDPSRLRGGLNGLALVALAGPASNVIAAVLLGAIAVLTAGAAPAFAQFAAHGVRQPLPGDLQHDPGAAARRLQAAARRARSGGGLQRTGAVRLHAPGGGGVDFGRRALDVDVELAGRAADLRGLPVGTIIVYSGNSEMQPFGRDLLPSGECRFYFLYRPIHLRWEQAATRISFPCNRL